MPEGSLPERPLRATLTSAPMRSSVRVKPMRAVLRLTFSTWIALPGRSTAAHTRNAADDGSPGTETSLAWSTCGPSTDDSRSDAVVGTPNSGSMSSVWLRDRAGSRRVVVPCA